MCLQSGLGQARTLASGNVEESTWSFRTSRNLAETICISGPMAPKPAAGIPTREHPGLYLGLLNLIGGVASRGPDGMSSGQCLTSMGHNGH